MDIQDKIKDLRSRILAGEEPPQDELSDCLKAYRIEREAASNKKVEKKEARDKMASVNVKDLFKKKQE